MWIIMSQIWPGILAKVYFGHVGTTLHWAYPVANLILFSSLSRSLDEYFSFRKAMDDVDATVRLDGLVRWTPPAILMTSCQIDARRFPFDTQRCPLRFVVWDKTVEQVDLVPFHKSDSVSKDLFIENGIWKFSDFTFQREAKSYQGARWVNKINLSIIYIFSSSELNGKLYHNPLPNYVKPRHILQSEHVFGGIGTK